MQNKVNQHSHLTKMLMIKLYLISMMDLKQKENGKLAEIGKKWFGENVSEPK